MLLFPLDDGCEAFFFKPGSGSTNVNSVRFFFLHLWNVNSVGAEAVGVGQRGRR